MEGKTEAASAPDVASSGVRCSFRKMSPRNLMACLFGENQIRVGIEIRRILVLLSNVLKKKKVPRKITN